VRREGSHGDRARVGRLQDGSDDVLPRPMADGGRGGQQPRCRLTPHGGAHTGGERSVGGDVGPRCGVIERLECGRARQDRAAVVAESDVSCTERHTREASGVEIRQAAGDRGQHGHGLPCGEPGSSPQQLGEGSARWVLGQVDPMRAELRRAQHGSAQPPREVLRHDVGGSGTRGRAPLLPCPHILRVSQGERQQRLTVQLATADHERHAPGMRVALVLPQPPLDRPSFAGGHGLCQPGRVDRTAREDAHAPSHPHAEGTRARWRRSVDNASADHSCDGVSRRDHASVRVFVLSTHRMLA
jgi:hypothetical protein